MKYRGFGHSGLWIRHKVRLHWNVGAYGPADDAQSLKTLAHAGELGVNLLDTADTYRNGHNEE
jgi:aryl-alcohol dehydrogenase-like predicted oxidoreductase